VFPPLTTGGCMRGVCVCGRPEKLEVSQGMQLDQVKRKIPSVLFSWDMYNMSREGQ